MTEKDFDADLRARAAAHPDGRTHAERTNPSDLPELESDPVTRAARRTASRALALFTEGLRTKDDEPVERKFTLSKETLDAVADYAAEQFRPLIPAANPSAYVHSVKCWPIYFDDLLKNRKSFDLRKDDRNYREGDVLHLLEFYPGNGAFSGVSCRRRINYILRDFAGLEKGYAILGLDPVEARP